MHTVPGTTRQVSYCRWGWLTGGEPVDGSWIQSAGLMICDDVVGGAAA